jgi:hypothetical protein
MLCRDSRVWHDACIFLIRTKFLKLEVTTREYVGTVPSMVLVSVSFS